MIQNTNLLSYKKTLPPPKTVPVKTEIPSKNIEKKEVKNSNSNKLILYGLAALAVAGAAILLINNAKKGKTNNVQKSAGNNLPADLSYMEKIKTYIANNFDKNHVEQKAKSIKLKMGTLNDFSQTQDELNLLSQISAINLDSKQACELQFPSLINISGVTANKTNYISNILSNVLACDFQHRKYSGRSLENFVQMLGGDNLSNAFKPTFMFIENYDQMIKDLKKPENSSLLKQFNTIFQNNEAKHISYLVSSEMPIDKTNSLLLKFNPEIKESRLISEAGYLNGINKVLENNYAEFQNRTSKYVESGNSLFDYQYIATEKISILFAEDGNEKYVHDFINEILKVTGGRYGQFDCKDKSMSEIANQLQILLEKQDEDFNLTGKKSYLYLQNLENVMKNSNKDSSEYKKIADLLKNADENFHTTAIISSDLKQDFIPAGNGSFVSFLTEAKKIESGKIDLILCGNIAEQQTNLQKFFINPLIAEQQGLKSEIDDGILIYGTSRNKDSFIKWLRNAAPVNYQEMQFDEKAPIESLEELVKKAKDGKTVFDLTGQRTLLNVKDIDKFLADFDTPEKRGNIGHFKAFAETLSNDYHTTIITKTDLNPETFESAAFERFGIPVELKDEIN